METLILDFVLYLLIAQRIIMLIIKQKHVYQYAMGHSLIQIIKFVLIFALSITIQIQQQDYVRFSALIIPQYLYTKILQIVHV